VAGASVAAPYDPSEFHPSTPDPGTSGFHAAAQADDRPAAEERNRVQKVLEDANVKIGDVLSDVFGLSGQLMLEALVNGLEGNCQPSADKRRSDSFAERILCGIHQDGD